MINKTDLINLFQYNFGRRNQANQKTKITSYRKNIVTSMMSAQFLVSLGPSPPRRTTRMPLSRCVGTRTQARSLPRPRTHSENESMQASESEENEQFLNCVILSAWTKHGAHDNNNMSVSDVRVRSTQRGSACEKDHYNGATGWRHNLHILFDL